MRLIFCLLFCLWTISPSLACSCYPPGLLDILEFNEADLVFVGKANEVIIDDNEEMRTVTFTITEAFKSPRPGKKVVVVTALHSAACGLVIQEGAKWYIWAEKASDGIYRTGLCSRSMKMVPELMTGEFDTRYHQDVRFMEELKGKKGMQTIEYDKGKAVGKICKGKPVKEWKYYDPDGILTMTCTYRKKGRESSCLKSGNDK